MLSIAFRQRVRHECALASLDLHHAFGTGSMCGETVALGHCGWSALRAREVEGCGRGCGRTTCLYGLQSANRTSYFISHRLNWAALSSPPTPHRPVRAQSRGNKLRL